MQPFVTTNNLAEIMVLLARLLDDEDLPNQQSNSSVTNVTKF